MEKTCPICKKKFEAGKHGKVYCCDECKLIAKRRREKQYWIDVAKGRRKRKLQGPRRERIFDNAKVKERLCLGNNCGKYFMSTGPDNRFCPKCTIKNQTYLRHNGDRAIFNPLAEAF